ncbi:MAG: hypothetical protein H0V01_00355 [Bacteroidetes bacterium]|nr:hypothetical protein [Bacteroidota bacterium]HET6245673.1 hypothetical protein [Bacteroidia bacterium]
MGLPLSTLIIIGIAVIAFVIFILYVVFSEKPEISQEKEDENDELIFDPVTGNYVTVEQLVENHKLDYLDEQKCQRVYDALSQEIKNELTFKDVETIMEFHYQVQATVTDEDEKNEEESVFVFLADTFEKKGRSISKNAIEKVIEIAKNKSFTN